MSRVSRRSFLRASAASGALLALPASAYRAAVLADEKPSDLIRVAVVGVGNQGKGDMNAVKKNVVAVCDVDKDRAAAAAKEIEKGGVTPFVTGDYRALL